jgi:hypothetical protein
MPPASTSLLPITGTFINEISFDIPSQNWGSREWREDFEAMHAIGIDTVIILKGGLRRETVFPSTAIGTPGADDLASLFLKESARLGMKLYFGTYDTWEWARTGQWKEEIALNRRFMREVQERYGSHPAFEGWYLTHETSHRRFHFRELYRELSEHAKTLTPDKPVLISPFYPSRKVYGDESLSPGEFADNWRQMLQGVTTIDYAAFQDGTATLDELDAYLSQASAVMTELGIVMWNNVETFTRDMPVKFPPIDIRELRAKLLIASKYAKKNITFEFSHFMSPHSCYPAARNLYARYRELVGR